MWNLQKPSLRRFREIAWWSPEVHSGGGGEVGEYGQKVQISNYKMNKFWECKVQPGDYTHQYCIVQLKVIEYILKVLTVKKKKKKL